MTETRQYDRCGCCGYRIDPNGECPCDWGWTECQTTHRRPAPDTSEAFYRSDDWPTLADVAADLASLAEAFEGMDDETAERLRAAVTAIDATLRATARPYRPDPVAICTMCAPTVPFDDHDLYRDHMYVEHHVQPSYFNADTVRDVDSETWGGYCYCGHSEGPHVDDDDGMPVCAACDLENDDDDELDPHHAYDPYA